MGIIENNQKRYPVYLNKLVINHIENNKDCDIVKYIEEYKQYKYVLEFIHKDILDLCELTNNNGNLFGGIVRSFLLRKEDTDDIDIWFTQENHMNNFIENIKEKWLAIESFVLIAQENYPSEKKKYYVTSPTTGFKYNIDIILSKDIPVDDYDINCLTFNKCFKLHNNSLSYKSVILNILKKEMHKLKTIKDTYYNLYRQKKFEEKGWKVIEHEEIINQSMGFYNYYDIICNNNVVNNNN